MKQAMKCAVVAAIAVTLVIGFSRIVERCHCAMTRGRMSLEIIGRIG